ncbi:E3 ubiquitin-protein ligase CCNB1IP1 isoform X3 [Cryptotermes secundus]|nr:E3 ubiquitin-protein ligase CCNB1IP1 isoform X3 [Cryptotermes secundus]
MVLAGLRPEIIMDVTNRALTFWHYQMYQELQYQKALNKRSCDNLTQAEETYTTEIMKLNALLQKEKRNTEALEKEVENQARHMGELQDQVVQKNRHLQNLMAMNNKLRCNTSTLQPDDGYDATKPKRRHYSLGLQTLRDLRPYDEVLPQNSSGQAQDFVFNPVTPPTRPDERRHFVTKK